MDQGNLEPKSQEIVRLNAELDKCKKFTNELVNASYDGYWDWHIKDDYEYISPRFWEILGYDPKEKKPHCSEWQKLIFADDLETVNRNLQKHTESKGEHPFVQEVRYRHRDGSTVTVLCRGKIIEWDDNNEPVRMIGTHTDVTKFKIQEQEIVNQNDYLKQLNKELEEFNYIASHDLQAPLRHITSFLDILVESLGEQLTEEEKEIIDTIQKAALKMKGLIYDLLDLSRVRTNKIELEEVDLQELVEELIEEEKMKENLDNITFRVHNLPTVIADKKQMKKLCAHLLSNAITYRKDNSTHHITITANLEDDYYVFTFSDNGIGFSQDESEKIFKVFTRLPGKKNRKGTGIGLAICKKILENHQGSIWAKGTPENGATFYFSLPKQNNYVKPERTYG